MMERHKAASPTFNAHVLFSSLCSGSHSLKTPPKYTGARRTSGWVGEVTGGLYPARRGSATTLIPVRPDRHDVVAGHGFVPAADGSARGRSPPPRRGAIDGRPIGGEPRSPAAPSAVPQRCSGAVPIKSASMSSMTNANRCCQRLNSPSASSFSTRRDCQRARCVLPCRNRAAARSASDLDRSARLNDWLSELTR